jgi:hypothetical protein
MILSGNFCGKPTKRETLDRWVLFVDARGRHSQAQDKLAALRDRRLIRCLSALSLAKEDQVNDNA